MSISGLMQRLMVHNLSKKAEGGQMVTTPHRAPCDAWSLVQVAETRSNKKAWCGLRWGWGGVTLTQARCPRQISCHTSPAATREERETHWPLRPGLVTRGRVERCGYLEQEGHICHLPGNLAILIHVNVLCCQAHLHFIRHRVTTAQLPACSLSVFPQSS